ncbi:DNA-3-methyladenine glycosylase [Phaeacidiphilus oryzae]|uniref:DNA-3-methyladenine glycosylase n=1 Tax=Phaeacidiphilus oryzae TaxID=348818 RepID=UPI00055BFE98|nr:DNA-3-methyladenine glycosylase [Phaeacidiphilus oryzae]
MSAPPPNPPLSRAFFDRPVLEAAPDLLGRILVHDHPDGRTALRLTEVEAYDGPDDPGAHSYRGRTPRNAVMFGPPGHVYVYFTYGMHYCMNLVTGPGERPSAVLLRAGEIVEGAELARARRPTARRDAELARGPARLATALGVAREENGADACPPEDPSAGTTRFHLLPGTPPPPAAVRTGPRTGLAQASDRPWRFWIADDPTVSPYRRHTPRRTRTRPARPTP